MGGSEGGLAPEECGVGTIVWVRRRNGSWWPGRILGQEELSASHLMSPRSGTPVKLLGREDASVDWYNLEKSKRVKAFRCGEFDTCIERAESSHGILIKKREKYARREDAILHALELEKQFLEKKEQKVGSANKYLVVSKTELPSGNYLNNDESLNHDRFVAKSQHQSRKAGPLKTESIDPLYSQKGKNDKHSSWEDDASEATPRMRGLQDFGLRSSQSKRKVDGPVAREITQRHFLVDSHGRAFPGSMQGMEEINNVKSGEIFPPLKNRRNQGCLDEELITKRRDRRRPLVQVLQSSAKLSASLPLQSDDGPIPVNMHVENDQILTLPTAEKSSGDNPLDSKNCLDQTECSSDLMQISPVHHRNPGSLVEENVSSGLNEAGESDSSGEVCSDDDPETEDDATLYQASTRPLLSMSKNEGRCAENDGMVTFPDQGYQNTDGNDEAFVSNHAHSQYLDQQSEDTSADLGVSKWNLKGKRNTRNLMKRPADSMNEMPDHIYLSSMNGGRSYERKRHPLMSSRGRAIRAGFYEKYDDFYGNNFIENDLSLQSTRDNSHRHSSMIKGVAEDNKEGSIDDSDEESLVMSPSGWEAGDQFDQYYDGYMDGDMESMWVDIDLKVQASYQGERVPLVSLMSKLNGKAIIGHPVQIEMLNDGSTDSLIARNDLGEDPTSCDGNETPLVWRTGRRTVMQRIPRSHPLPAALNGKEDDSFLYSDPEIKPTFKRPYAIHLDSGIRLAKKTPNSNRPIKYQKKTSKKLSLSNQKVRKLSSFETQLKLGRAHAAGDKLNSKGRSIVDALIKPGSMPMVTCVPVKVVFSRILEAVGRSYFTVKTHQSLASSSSESKPS